MRVTGVQHVSIGIESGREAEARRFYSDVLGLSEKRRPMGLKHMALIWYALGDGEQEIHLVCNDPATFGPTRAGDQFCMTVDDLETCRETFERHRIPVRDGTPIGNRPRLFVRDPFENLIELVQILGDYRPVDE